ncbi:MAG: RNA polymerase sigma factor [Planctomycetes bacterium]|nr:RNA polymerase sigma factor [Planctomycetota bacterium]
MSRPGETEADEGVDGAQARFLRLLDAHKALVHRVASCYGRGAADRADLVQEVVAQLWRAFGHYDERRPFSTWAYRIALNVAISHGRKETRRRRLVVPADGELIAAAEDPPQDERLQPLRAAIERLGPADRALVLLHLDGQPHAAIAEILGLSESNVGTRLGRVKERLRRELTRERPGEGAR